MAPTPYAKPQRERRQLHRGPRPGPALGRRATAATHPPFVGADVSASAADGARVVRLRREGMEETRESQRKARVVQRRHHGYAQTYGLSNAARVPHLRVSRRPTSRARARRRAPARSRSTPASPTRLRLPSRAACWGSGYGSWRLHRFTGSSPNLRTCDVARQGDRRDSAFGPDCHIVGLCNKAAKCAEGAPALAQRALPTKVLWPHHRSAPTCRGWCVHRGR